MKIIISGTRTFNDYDTFKKVIRLALIKQNAVKEELEIVTGGCRGVDLLGERWAKENNIPIKRFDAEWKKYGRQAGPIRNRAMAKYGDFLVAVWDGDSPGTLNMILNMKSFGKTGYVYKFK